MSVPVNKLNCDMQKQYFHIVDLLRCCFLLLLLFENKVPFTLVVMATRCFVCYQPQKEKVVIGTAQEQASEIQVQ